MQSFPISFPFPGVLKNTFGYFFFGGGNYNTCKLLAWTVDL